MARQRRHPILISAILILFLGLSAGVATKPEPIDGEKIIEVCMNGIVYVPPGTKYVTCRGKIMKIIRITPYKRGDESCVCPRCCDGICAVIVSCDGFSEWPDSGPDMRSEDYESLAESGVDNLCTLWLYCN
jgi:hypothetical protein